jgi:hypothetical protein
MLHLITTVHVGQIARVPGFLEHYLEAGVDKIWLTIHAPDQATMARAAAAIAEMGRVAGHGLVKVAWLIGPYDLVRLQCNHDRIRCLATEPDDWILWPDVDELQVHPAPLRELLADVEVEGANAVSGEMIDRVARGGVLEGPVSERPLWSQYPLGCSITADILGATTHKVAIARGSLRVLPGQHEARGEGAEPVHWSRILAAVHHFKWDATVAARLQMRVEPDIRAQQSWWPESERALFHLTEHGHIDLSRLAVHDFGDGRHRRDDPAAWAFVRAQRAGNPRWSATHGVATMNPRRFASDPATPPPADPVDRALLARCRRFRTMDAHTGAILTAIGAGAEHGRRIRGVLARLAAEERLVDERGFVRRVARKPPSDDAPARIGTIGFVTRDRPESLVRAVASYVEHAHAHGREPFTVVVDDGVARPARQALESCAASLRSPIAYAGVTEKAAFAARIARAAGVPLELVSFAFLDVLDTGVSYGANRNALLLAAAGDGLLSADDDTLCQPLQTARREQWVLASGRVPIDYRFFPDLAAGLAESERLDADVLGCLDGVLGRGVVGLIADAKSAVDLGRLDAEGIRRLSGRPGRVIAVVLGMLGDAGGDSPLHAVLATRGEGHRQLVATEASWRTALQSRIHLRAARQPTLATGGLFMTTAVALDARDILPPFFPIFRCEDNIYGSMLRRCRPRDWVAHLPVALVHEPVEPRCYAGIAESVSEIGTPMAVFVQALTDAAPIADVEGNDALRSLGEFLQEVAGEPGLPRRLRAIEIGILRGRLEDVQRCRQTYADSPQWWHRDLATYAAALESRVDECDGLAAEVATHDQMRTLLGRYGSLLSAWPDVWRAARELRAEGIELARPLVR